MKLFFIILILSLAMTGCSNKKSKGTLKINLGNIFGSGTYMDGGVYLLGHSVDDKEKISMFILDPNKEISLDLIKGKWEFAAIGWAGLGLGIKDQDLFKGQNQCAYSGYIDLNSDQVNITMNLNYATCADIPNHGAVISSPSFLNSAVHPNQFFQIQISSCNKLDYINKTCDDNLGTAILPDGLTRSVRVAVDGNMQGSRGSTNLPGAVSSCYAVPAGSSATLDLKIPVGNLISAKSEMLLKPRFILYTTDDCTGSSIDYFVKDKSLFEGLNNLHQKTALVDGGGFSKILFEHNPTTVSEIGGFNRFGYGKDGDLDRSTASTYEQVPTTEFGQVTNMSDGVGDSTVITLSGSNGTNINLNDEIMIYVNTSETAMGPGCGTGFVSGMFINAFVKGRTFGPNEIITNFNIKNYMTHPSGGAEVPVVLPYPAAGNLAQTYGTAGSCSIQVVKVRNYRNVKIGNQSIMKTQPFNKTVHYGGILAFRIADKLEITSLSGTRSFVYASAPSYGGGDNLSGQYQGAPDCYTQGKACVMFGKVTDNNAKGGGIIFADIGNMYFKGSSNNIGIEFDSSADTGTVGLSGSQYANGGHMNINIGKITVDNTVVPQLFLQNNSSADVGPIYYGTPGPTYLKYCELDAGFNINTIASASILGTSGPDYSAYFNIQNKCN